jgi:general secretion pathway protein A
LCSKCHIHNLVSGDDMPLTTEYLDQQGKGGVQQINFYQFLNVGINASLKEINLACQKKVKQIGVARKGDLSPEKESELRAEFDLVREAYSILSEKNKRLAYNRELFSDNEKEEPIPSSFFKSIRSETAKIEKSKPAQNPNRSVYKNFFGFSEKPFHLSPNPKYLYLSAKHKEVLAHLVFGLQENNGFLKIIGEVGTGKTMICKSFLKELHTNFSIAYIIHPSVNSLELLQTINSELGLPSRSNNKKELTNILNRFLIEERLKGHRVVVIIDEAQDLTVPVLEELRLLSNMETETEKLLQIVLIGQPELDKVLAKSELRQLRQRITVQWELLPLSKEECRGYIHHRLSVAKGKGKVNFTRPAMDLVYRYSQGIPRMINVLADRALLVGFTLNSKKIDKHIVNQAVKEIGAARSPAWQAGPLRKLVLSGIAVVGAVALALGFYVNMNAIPFSAGKSDVNSESQINSRDKSSSQSRLAKTVSKPVLIKSPSVISNQINESEDLLRLTLPEKLVSYLSPMSYSESLGESVKWVLHGWGVTQKDDALNQSYMLDRMGKKYGLSVFSINSDMRHLKQLNQPAILEITLPDFKGSRYVALTAIKGNTAILGSMDRVEMPLSALEKLWSRKAIILWKNFEKLPEKFQKGFRGKEVMWLQNNLRSIGFFQGKQARAYGPKTEKAVKSFQRKYGISASGSFTDESKIMLYSLLNNYPTPGLKQS